MLHFVSYFYATVLLIYNNCSKTLNWGISYFRTKDGYDFRDAFRLGLYQLLLIERFLIALVRLHHIACKWQAVHGLLWSSIKIYAIIFDIIH